MPRSRFPHPLVLLTGCIFIAALLSHILPAGQYDRRDDPATGRKVVVDGSYHSVPQKPLYAIPVTLGAGAVLFGIAIGLR